MKQRLTSAAAAELDGEPPLLRVPATIPFGSDAYGADFGFGGGTKLAERRDAAVGTRNVRMADAVLRIERGIPQVSDEFIDLVATANKGVAAWTRLKDQESLATAIAGTTRLEKNERVAPKIAELACHFAAQRPAVSRFGPRAESTARGSPGSWHDIAAPASDRASAVADRAPPA